MNFGHNYEHVKSLLELARDIAALDSQYINYSGVLPNAVREWQKQAKDLIAKMDTD